MRYGRVTKLRIFTNRTKMSRLAKKPISVLEGVSITQAGESWIFKGPKGELKKTPSPYVTVERSEGGFVLSLKAGAPKNAYAMLGTAYAIFKNCISGVKDGFEKKLEIEGIGYKAQLDGKDLLLSLGFTHPVRIEAPEGTSFKVEKNSITVSGADKEMVGIVAARIRGKKPPEPYKGKGIRYAGEIIRRKAGKKAVAAA